MQSPKEQTQNLTDKSGKPVTMQQLLSERLSAIPQQSQPCEGIQDKLVQNAAKAGKRRQISDGDASNLLRPLKRYLVSKQNGNRQSMQSPNKSPAGLQPNASFQSVYEQLNNTRLLSNISNRSSLNSSPYGHPKAKFAKVVKGPEARNLQEQFELSVGEISHQALINPITSIETDTPKTTQTKLKKNQNVKNSNKNNMMSQSYSMAATNAQFRRTNTGGGLKDLGSPATCPIYLTNSPLKLQAKSSTKVSQLHKSGAAKSPYNSQMLLTKNNSTFASNQTMSLAYRSNTSKSKILNPLSDSLHSSMHQLPSQNSQTQLYQPKYNKPKISDFGSQKGVEGFTSPYTEKSYKQFVEQTDSKPNKQFPTNNYNQSTS